MTLPRMPRYGTDNEKIEWEKPFDDSWNTPEPKINKCRWCNFKNSKQRMIELHEKKCTSRPDSQRAERDYLAANHCPAEFDSDLAGSAWRYDMPPTDWNKAQSKRSAPARASVFSE